MVKFNDSWLPEHPVLVSATTCALLLPHVVLTYFLKVLKFCAKFLKKL